MRFRRRTGASSSVEGRVRMVVVGKLSLAASRPPEAHARAGLRTGFNSQKRYEAFGGSAALNLAGRRSSLNPRSKTSVPLPAEGSTLTASNSVRRLAE